MEIMGDVGVKLVGLIYDINQDLKNSKKESDYTILKGKYVSFKTNSEDLVHNICSPILSKTRKGHLDEYLDKINGYVNGKELFAFFKEYKKFVNGIILSDDDFTITTSVPEVEYKSGSLRFNQQRDVEPYREFFSKALKPFKNKKHLIGSVELEKEKMEQIKTAKSPITIGVVGSKGQNVRFKATHKIFLGYKAKSNIKVMFFEIDREKNLYLVDIIMENPHFKSDNYFVIINY